MYDYRPIQFSPKNKYTYTHIKSYLDKTFSGLIFYIPPGIDSQTSTRWKFSGQTSEQCAILFRQKTMRPSSHGRPFGSSLLSLISSPTPHQPTLWPLKICKFRINSQSPPIKQIQGPTALLLHCFNHSTNYLITVIALTVSWQKCY